MMELLHDFDDNGVCQGCGFERPQITFFEKRTQGVVQRVNFITPVVLKNGESLRVPFPITDSSGEIIPGDFVGEVSRNNVVKIIGKG